MFKKIFLALAIACCRLAIPYSQLSFSDWTSRSVTQWSSHLCLPQVLVLCPLLVNTGVSADLQASLYLVRLLLYYTFLKKPAS